MVKERTTSGILIQKCGRVSGTVFLPTSYPQRPWPLTGSLCLFHVFWVSTNNSLPCTVFHQPFLFVC